MEKIDSIFFIGPQGSGKGTQARKLSEKLGFFYWEMGGILRDEAKKDTDLGQRVGKLIDDGFLLSDEMLLEVFKSRISEIPKTEGVIFDGIPRRVGQAHYIMEVLANQNRKNLVTIFLDIPEEVSIQRLLKRGEIEHRSDDIEEKIRFRLEQYYHDTLPVLDFMRQQTKFIDIDGKPTIDEVTQSINHSLGLE